MKSNVTNRRVLSWAFYDWANSAFATTVMAGFFPLFFKNYISEGVPTELSSLRLGLTNSLAGITLALAAPFLATFADTRRLRKPALFGFTVFGAIFTAALSLCNQGSWLCGAWLYGLASFCFSGAIVFYDSFLTDLSDESSADNVSGFGYALGYLGGGILFALNVWMFLKPAQFGLVNGTAAVKLSFVTVGIWWLVFSLPMLLWVPEQNSTSRNDSAHTDTTTSPLIELRTTIRSVLQRREVWLFLLAYWIYIDGVNTVVKMAIDYGVSVGFAPSLLIGALLVTQFVGFPSAIVYCRLSARFGTGPMIGFGLAVYTLVALWASRVTSPWEFYGLAITIGLVQGGVQALSRSLFSSMVPAAESARYFSLFNLVGKFASIIGPALIGITTYLSQSHRTGILSLTLLFGAGYLLLRASQMHTINRARTESL